MKKEQAKKERERLKKLVGEYLDEIDYYKSRL